MCISFHAGRLCFELCRHEESRHTPEVCIPRAYFHEYLAQNPTYSRQTKAHVMYGPRPLRVYRYHAVWLRFDSADTRNLVIAPEVCIPRAYFHKYLAQNPTYSRQTKAHVMYEPRPLRVYRFMRVGCVLTLPTRGISSYSGGVYTPSLLSRISRSKPNLLAPNQSPCDVRTSAFTCISLSRGLVAFWVCRHERIRHSLRRCAYPEPTFTNISLRTQPTRAKPKLM